MTMFQKTFCWLVLVAGLVILGFAVRSAKRDYDAVVQWPSVKATITRGRVVYASQQRRPRYVVEYSFAYRIHDTAYTSAASEVASDYHEAQEMLGRHPTGSTVLLHYNPRNPAETEMNAALTPQFFKASLMLAGASLACIFVGGMPLWRDAHRLRVDQILCPNCQRSMDRGRRFCPFCKEELVRY